MKIILKKERKKIERKVASIKVFMKKIALFLLCLFCFACSPKLRSNITSALPPLSENDLVVVLDMIDDQYISAKKVGELKATDNGLSQNCTYFQNIESLKAIARQNGANLLKITKHKRPDNWSSCHRIYADMYKVEDPKVYETTIAWSEHRKLTWDDFKGEPDLVNFPNALAVTNSGMSYESERQLFTNGKVFIQSMFNTYQSWVLPEGRTEYVLRHEQIHFDLTEIYTRKLRKAFQDANITSSDAYEARQIFDKISSELSMKQEQYDAETIRGERTDIQEKWEAIVVIELAKYDLYKSNR